MKFSTILPFVVGALATVTRRQDDPAQQIAPALENIITATNSLNTAVQGFSGDLTDVTDATANVFATIAAAEAIVSQVPDGSVGGLTAIGLSDPTMDLNAAVSTAIDSTIAQKDALVAAGFGDEVLASLQQQLAASQSLTNNIVRALDPALQDFGRQQGQPALDDIQRGIDAFADQAQATTTPVEQATTTTPAEEATTTPAETTDDGSNTDAPVYPTDAPVYPTSDAPYYPIESATIPYYPTKGAAPTYGCDCSHDSPEAPVYTKPVTYVTYCPEPTSLVWYGSTVVVEHPETLTLTYTKTEVVVHPTAGPTEDSHPTAYVPAPTAVVTKTACSVAVPAGSAPAAPAPAAAAPAPAADNGNAVQQIGDGQVQAPANGNAAPAPASGNAAPAPANGNAVQQIGDGQVQAPANGNAAPAPAANNGNAVQQIGDGQVQVQPQSSSTPAAGTTPEVYQGAASAVNVGAFGAFAVVAVVVAAF